MVDTFTVSPGSPTVGEEVTFTADSITECGDDVYEFTVDGEPPPPGSTISGGTLKTTFTTEGDHVVRVTPSTPV